MSITVNYAKLGHTLNKHFLSKLCICICNKGVDYISSIHIISSISELEKLFTKDEYYLDDLDSIYDLTT